MTQSVIRAHIKTIIECVVIGFSKQRCIDYITYPHNNNQMKTNIRKESQRRLLRIHFFNDNENESDVIHETLIWQKV